MNHITHRSTSLQTHFDDMAQRMIEYGSGTEARRLGELAIAVRHIAPGAAAALDDVDGSEIARLRAFSVAVARVSRLSTEDCEFLLCQFENRFQAAVAA